MERHMEESHPDRGDTQRSVFLYQNLTVGFFYVTVALNICRDSSPSKKFFYFIRDLKLIFDSWKQSFSRFIFILMYLIGFCADMKWNV